VYGGIGQAAQGDSQEAIEAVRQSLTP